LGGVIWDLDDASLIPEFAAKLGRFGGVSVCEFQSSAFVA